RWRSLPGDEPDDGLAEFPSDEGGGFLLGSAPDLGNHGHRFSVGVGGKQAKRVDEAGPNQRISADADAGRLSHALLRELVDRFVGQRSTLRHDADATLAANVAGDDARFSLSSRDDARTVGSNQA